MVPCQDEKDRIRHMSLQSERWVFDSRHFKEDQMALTDFQCPSDSDPLSRLTVIVKHLRAANLNPVFPDVSQQPYRIPRLLSRTHLISCQQIILQSRELIMSLRFSCNWFASTSAFLTVSNGQMKHYIQNYITAHPDDFFLG